jgi:hypothetical protein
MEGEPMTTAEFRECVAAIEARRDEEGNYRAGALATAVAYRLDQRIAAIDRDLARDRAWRGIVDMRAWKAQRRAAA